MKSDEVIEQVGAFGKYQIRQMVLASLPSFPCAFHFIILVFHSITPDFRCKLPDYPNDTYRIQDPLHNSSIQSLVPLTETHELDTCSLYNSNNTNSTFECSEYVFSRDSSDGNTVVTQFDLVCSRKSLSTISKVVYTAGLVTGSAVISMIADWLGRKKTIVLALVLGNSFALATMFSVNVAMYSAMRFGLAFCFVGALVVAHVLVIEITGPSKRTIPMALKGLFWTSGVMTLSLVAYYIRDWNYLQLAATVPGCIATLLAIIFMKESPKWLISKGRHEEALKLFENIALVNGRDIPAKLEETIAEDEESGMKERIVSIFKARILLIRVLVMLYLWFATGIGYYGLSLGVGNLAGSIYINNLISGVAEIFTTPLILASRWLGRKKIYLTCVFLGSISLIISAVLTSYLNLSVYGGMVIAISMIGKASVTTLSGFNYFWSSEMFPTTLRSSLVGLCSLMARVGTMLAPVIADLHMYVQTSFGGGIGPFIIGITMFIGGILTCFLPETNNQKVPETIEEADMFGTDRAQADRQRTQNGIISSADNKIEMSKL